MLSGEFNAQIFLETIYTNGFLYGIIGRKLVKRYMEWKK